MNKQELIEAIAKKVTSLSRGLAAAKEKATDKKADPAVRKARKKVKRAQRKLRAAKAYKTGGKKVKKGEAAAS